MLGKLRWRMEAVFSPDSGVRAYYGDSAGSVWGRGGPPGRMERALLLPTPVIKSMDSTVHRPQRVRVSGRELYLDV